MSEKNPFHGATFAERKAIREAAESGETVVESDVKQVDADVAEVEDKAVRPSETKKRTTRRKS